MKLKRKYYIILSCVCVYILFWCIGIYQGSKTQKACVDRIKKQTFDGKRLDYKKINIPKSLDSLNDTKDALYWSKIYCPCPFFLIFYFGHNNTSRAYDSVTYYLDFFGYIYIIRENLSSKNYESTDAP